MAFNPRGLYGADVRRVFSGKDSIIVDATTGALLSTVDQFQAQVNFTNATYQPLGSPIQQEFMTAYSVTLTITQCIIEDDRFVRDMFDFFTNCRHRIFSATTAPNCATFSMTACRTATSICTI